MDQKLMELLAKIYQTQTEMRSDINELRTGFKELGTEVKELRTGFKELGTEVKELGTEVKELRTGFKELGIEVKGLKTEVQELRTEFTDLRNGQETLAFNVAKIMTVVEYDVAHKIGAIYDFREIQLDHNQKTSEAMERIEAKVEVLQLETAHLRRVK